MDTTTVLDKYTQDLSNLPLEIKHLLQELKNKDIQLQEARKKYQTKDNQLHKFIRANGTLTKHPKEAIIITKIEEDFEVIKRLQKEKILLSNTALFLVSKYLFNFETDITKLERDALLPALDGPLELDSGSTLNSVLGGLSDGLSGSTTPRGASTPGSESMMRRTGTNTGANGGAGYKRKFMGMRNMNGSRPHKRPRSDDSDDDLHMDSLKGSGVGLNGSLDIHGDGEGPGNSHGPGNEDADNNLYCFCQRVSFGEMIGCDNDDCKYEWFHWSCVGITAPPKDDEVWYCNDCAPRMEKRKKKRKQ